ncbi:MAG: mechanosensitive ion channel domain-containing protein [Gemmataceae bacterium]
MLHAWFIVSMLSGTAPIVPPSPTKPDDKALAEKILRVRETIEKTRKALQKMQAALDDPEGEYPRAKEEYDSFQQRVEDEEVAIKRLLSEGQQEKAMQQQAKLGPLKQSLEEARARYNLAIVKRKAQQDALTAMKKRLEKEQIELDRLEGKEKPEQAKEPSPPDQPSTLAEKPEKSAPTEKSGPPSSTSANISPPNRPTARAKVIEESKEVKQARYELEQRLKALQEAQAKVDNAQERVNALQEAIAAASRLLDAERQISDQAAQLLMQLTQRLQQLPPNRTQDRQEIAERLAETNKRLHDSRMRARSLTDRVNTLNSELIQLEQERRAALEESERRRVEAEAADKKLQAVSNPFTPRNLLRWLAAHGPNLLLITAVTLGLYFTARFVAQHLVRFISQATSRGGPEDRVNRANTLAGVFRYVSGVFILGGGLVMLLDEAGVPIVPLMGGAAVVGLAVAFGSQNLIKDYFSGFMLLMEDQYGVNDVVRIGETAGTVEQITLRVTVLRDLEGVRHFIPHGSITRVSNLTHTWSRAFFKIPVNCAEDVDRTMKVLLELARELRDDPLYGSYILEEPEMLGVDAFDASNIVLKFYLKTRPLRQWTIKREMLRRIKKRFDAEGIVSPFSPLPPKKEEIIDGEKIERRKAG